MKIFAISLNEETINDFKIWRLKDVTRFLCPFDRNHGFTNAKEAIKHIVTCKILSIHGINGETAKENSSKWTICNSDNSHMFHKDYENLHYFIQDRCRPDKDVNIGSWRNK